MCPGESLGMATARQLQSGLGHWSPSTLMSLSPNPESSRHECPLVRCVNPLSQPPYPFLPAAQRRSPRGTRGTAAEPQGVVSFLPADGGVGLLGRVGLLATLARPEAVRREWAGPRRLWARMPRAARSQTRARHAACAAPTSRRRSRWATNPAAPLCFTIPAGGGVGCLLYTSPSPRD